MLEIVIRADGGIGKSTLAALVGNYLESLGLPVEVRDEDYGVLSARPDRLRSNTASIAGRETAAGAKIVVRTEQLNRPPRYNPPAKDVPQ